MTTPDIIRKLAIELDSGITTEVQVVYVLAGIRKIIERDEIAIQYAALRFHCDWALHSRMYRAAAKAILKQFDAAYALLRTGELPPEINRISQMKLFKKELVRFLSTYGLPTLTQRRSDGWVHFLHLYTKVIEDIPLVVSAPATAKKRSHTDQGRPQHISHVTVGCEEARETRKDSYGNEEMMFKVTWNIRDRDGQCGEIFIINSFSLNAE
jgi:hypothetical protein